MTDAGPGAWESLLATFVLNAGLALTVGALASLVWTTHARSGWAAILRARSSACLALGIGLTVVAEVGDLWARSADAAGVAWPDAWPAVRSMLTASHYGSAWIAGMLALLGLAAIARFGLADRRHSSASALSAASVCIAVFVYTRSVVSHASQGGDLSLSVAVDWLHLVLIALWVGVVFVASVVAGIVGPEPSRAAVEDRHDLVEWIGALSRTATLALVGIVVTGSFNVWRGTGGALASLPGSTYGTVLFAKLCFVVVAIALGAYNRFRILPPLFADLRRAQGTSMPLRHFIRVIRCEAATLAVALALAAVLGATEADATS